MKPWPTKPLGDFVAKKSGSVNPSKFPDEVFDLYSIPAFDSGGPEVRAGSEIGSAKQIVEPRDVLLSRIVPHIRRAWVVGENRGRRLIGSGEWIVFRSPQLHPRFLRYFLVGDPFHGRFMQTVSGVGGSLLRAKASEVAKIEIPVPPLPEQERIVKLLDEADELRKLRAEADRRTTALLPAYFTELFGDPTHIEKMRWPFKPLGEFAAVSYGLADKLDASTKPENGTRILTISNVLLQGSIDIKVEKYSVVQPDERAKARIQKFDLLFNWRNGSEEHVGKTAIWEQQVEGEVLHVSFLLKIRADQRQANPYFLWALINRLRATGYFTRNARMQINRKFNASELSALVLPLPPLPLQKEFAQRVAEIRALEALQVASRQRLESLFQSLLHRAFAGEI